MESKNIIRDLAVVTNKVSFAYFTKTGKYKEQSRIFKTIKDEDPKQIFKDWIKEQRTIFNAKILNIVELKKEKMRL